MTHPAVTIQNSRPRNLLGGYATATTAITTCITAQLKTFLQFKVSFCTSHRHHNHLPVLCSWMLSWSLTATSQLPLASCHFLKSFPLSCWRVPLTSCLLPIRRLLWKGAHQRVFDQGPLNQHHAPTSQPSVWCISVPSLCWCVSPCHVKVPMA